VIRWWGGGRDEADGGAAPGARRGLREAVACSGEFRGQ
jgi:hypothetical protein